ncbi:MAG: hypothetical protein E5W04_29875 [Mesorhizobium sp.]|nr:MAG: hypothetical protein E5W04_29875 [Mesorhizobium sp.]
MHAASRPVPRPGRQLRMPARRAGERRLPGRSAEMHDPRRRADTGWLRLPQGHACRPRRQGLRARQAAAAQPMPHSWPGAQCRWRLRLPEGDGVEGQSLRAGQEAASMLHPRPVPQQTRRLRVSTRHRSDRR